MIIDSIEFYLHLGILKMSKAASRSLPTRYLKVAVVVEYNIYDRHFKRDRQATLSHVLDLFVGVNKVYIGPLKHQLISRD